MAITWKQIAFVPDVVSLQASTPGTAQTGHVNISGTYVSGALSALVTLPESWIGPSDLAGIYFKGGNVGIGTTTPTFPLSVNGNIGLLPNGSTNRTIDFGTAYGQPALSLYSLGGIQVWGWGLNGGEMQFFGTGNTGDHISFNKGGGFQPSGTNEVMRINLNTGNVGIGTTTPVSPLQVNGLLNTKNYTVATLPAATRGDIAYVTDALAPAFLTILVGGGSVVTPAFYNGTSWIGF